MAKAELTSADRSEYRRLCKVVDEKMSSFVEVGQALKRIKDGKLYLTEFDTWDEFCEKRFSIHRNYANKMIAAAKVVENVCQDKSALNGYPGTHSNGKNVEKNGEIVPITEAPEKVVRSLTQLPADQQSEAWEKAVEKAGGKQPTAAQVKEAVAEVKAESEPILDALGQPIPDHLVPVFRCEFYDDLESSLKQSLRKVYHSADYPSCYWLVRDLETHKTGDKVIHRFHHADEILRSVRYCKPYCVCPSCKGKGCTRCERQGWLNEMGWKATKGQDQ